MTDHSWSALSGGGWGRAESANDRIISDSTAPLSPTNVLEYIYPVGFKGGVSPASEHYPLKAKKELFIGLWWEVSEPWQGHESGVNKIQFLYLEKYSDVAFVMYGVKGGPYELRVMPQWREHDGRWLTPNVNHLTVALGQWHLIEWYLKYESAYGVGDGIIRWWMDGALVGNYTNLRFPDDPGFAEYQISPTWGGVGDVKIETDYYRFNHSYISSPVNTAF